MNPDWLFIGTTMVVLGLLMALVCFYCLYRLHRFGRLGTHRKYEIIHKLLNMPSIGVFGLGLALIMGLWVVVIFGTLLWWFLFNLMQYFLVDHLRRKYTHR